jgi:pimeloyl-ACP methyl ester carboxylesterase
MVADRYAQLFAATGLAVLLYDHRGMGDSGGEPRRQINTWLQAREYRDALSYATTIEGVDPARMALWGDSLSAGVALAVAGIDDRVAALVGQVPAIGAALPPPDPTGSLYEAFRETVLGGRIHPEPAEVEGPMPVVSHDQGARPSALKPLTAYRWFMEYGDRPGTGWINDITRANCDTPAPWHPSLCAKHVRCPVQLIVSPEDEMPGAAPAVSYDAFRRLSGPKEWLEVEGGHFGLLYWPSPAFALAATAQARFLAAHLLPADPSFEGRSAER